MTEECRQEISREACPHACLCATFWQEGAMMKTSVTIEKTSLAKDAG